MASGRSSVYERIYDGILDQLRPNVAATGGLVQLQPVQTVTVTFTPSAEESRETPSLGLPDTPISPLAHPTVTVTVRDTHMPSVSEHPASSTTQRTGQEVFEAPTSTEAPLTVTTTIHETIILTSPPSETMSTTSSAGEEDLQAPSLATTVPLSQPTNLGQQKVIQAPEHSRELDEVDVHMQVPGQAVTQRAAAHECVMYFYTEYF
ncbi:hypothetical protein DENSPDRAFT_855021 [Dentipellis sp. KUC8613]|nr:hypothetical protein DENSPDRAFT_855021 [Dentipellis sp. KUC8613]